MPSLAIIDLDNFKEINDLCGHPAGDQVLISTATSLLRFFPGSEICRLGGDEFAIADPRSPEELQKTCDEWLELIAKTSMNCGERSFRSTASVGIASINAPEEIEDAYINADLACYKAKNSGKGISFLFQPESSELAAQKARTSWVDKVRRALSEEDDSFELRLYCQEIRHLSSPEKPAFAEVLIRLFDAETQTVIPAYKFIDAVALKPRLTRELDRWVVRETIRGLKQQDRYNEHSINISAHSFSEEGFPDFLIEEARSHGVKPSQLHLEITEQQAPDLPICKKVFPRLRAEGFKICLDDFGTGYSSLSYLQNLDFDILKIDGSFVRSCLSKPNSEKCVRLAMFAAQLYELDVVAEYVENQEVMAYLRQIREEMALPETSGLWGQGWEIGKPSPCGNCQ